MLMLWLVCLFALIIPSHVSAIDLTIKDPVISDLTITLSASLSATSNYYLQGTLRSQSSSKYFGETQNNRGDWIDYVSSPEKEYITSNFFLTDVKNATWSGTLNMRFKLDDPNYLGPGPYDLKLRRFTGNGTSPAGESNTLTITLAANLPTPTPTPSPTPSPSPSPTPSPSPIPSPTRTPAPSVVLKDEVGSSPPIGTVAGETSGIDLSGFGISLPASPKSSDAGGSPNSRPTLNKSRAKTALTVGAGLILVSVAGFFGYRKYLTRRSLGEGGSLVQ